MPRASRSFPPGAVTPGAYAALARLSAGYSPLEGRLPTHYSPVRHCTAVLRQLLVRLACVRRAASVRSEPGSNSHECHLHRAPPATAARHLPSLSSLTLFSCQRTSRSTKFHRGRAIYNKELGLSRAGSDRRAAGEDRCGVKLIVSVATTCCPSVGETWESCACISWRSNRARRFTEPGGSAAFTSPQRKISDLYRQIDETVRPKQFGLHRLGRHHEGV